MKSLPEDITTDDIGQWLSHGWFLYQPSSDSEEKVVATLTTNRRGWAIKTLDGTTHDLMRDKVFPYWPACGALNLDGFAVYMERIQLRQYRRTYNDACLRLRTPRKWDVMKLKGTKSGVLNPNSLKIVQAAFFPTYHDYSAALDMMEDNKWISVALTPHLIVAGPLVYYRGKLVAKVEGMKLVPFGCSESRIRRIVKFFEGRISL